MELFNLAIQTDSNDLNMTVFKQYLHKSSNNEDIEKTLTQRGLTEEELKLLENSLTEQLPPAQIQHAMLILRGLRKGASFRDREIAIVSFIRVYFCVPVVFFLVAFKISQFCINFLKEFFNASLFSMTFLFLHCIQ